MAISSAGIGDYLKRAFLYRWNLLVFLGGLGAAAISPAPDALLPIVAAGELIYLTGLVSNTKFRQAVDASLHQQTRQQAAVAGQRSLQEIVAGFPPDARLRFERLRTRCLEMRDIAHGVRGRGATDPAVEDTSGPALDRLLWVFLRLLTSQQFLHRFLERTDVNEIRQRLAEAHRRLASDAQPSADERITRSLQDSVKVQEQRLENYEKARQNFEFLQVELDRIEAKIQAITEAAVNRQDPNFLSSQIDSVAESMQSTERALSELHQLTGYVDELQEPPMILESDYRESNQRQTSQQ